MLYGLLEYSLLLISVWLKFLFSSLGIEIMNINHKLIIFGITGDCPALSLITNFISHNGYYCCWFCLIRGEHIDNKRQYRYETFVSRTSRHYIELSAKAERTQANVLGHLGKSVLDDILDIPLPNEIVLDYLHVSLLGHAKLIISSIYKRLKPFQREELSSQMNEQTFPRRLLVTM